MKNTGGPQCITTQGSGRRAFGEGCLHLWAAICLLSCLLVSPLLGQEVPAGDRLQISGVYPHLAYWNTDAECGTGAVVPWAGRLWVITYSPHRPQGSTDKLYEITPELEMTPFEGSVGGTPANRMIHNESNQLIIGPYVIAADGTVRVITPSTMYGRLTGNARHLFEPERKVYYATMEEGFYEVDMQTLEVTELFPDNQRQVQGGPANTAEAPKRLADMPGYHGKGMYSGQGRLIYANNGEVSEEARRRPDVPSGCLAEWDGKSDLWRVVRRNQFTDVRGPGGLYGNADPDTDPVWAIGWDHRSLLLMVLDEGVWHTYRLPKASHTYDGAHGWNTEWPRIHDIGEDDFVMNMHGMFWRFPRTFSFANSGGILPRSTYLKVIGDYCRWGDRLVFGCDDTAKSEFLNKRRAKGNIAGPGQSHSNLWFAEPSILDALGIPIGRGAVWVDEPVCKDAPSEPYLFSGFERRSVCIVNGGDEPVVFSFEVDAKGDGRWQPFKRFTVGGGAAVWHNFDAGDRGVWLRISTNRDCRKATVQFHYSQADKRTTEPGRMFAGVVRPASKSLSGGLVRVRGENLKTLAFAAVQVVDGQAAEPRFYEMGGDMKLRLVEDAAALKWTMDNVGIPDAVLTVDAASVVYVDDDGNRWRLPKGDPAFDGAGLLGAERVCREVVTERDLFNCHGTFYELPARNAGGFAKIRPICTHNRRIKDYCSYRGLLILSGVDSDAPAEDGHIIRSDDGAVALWAGVVDDLWRFGKPVGTGGPWKGTSVQAGQPSDPYLMTGYDEKTLILSTASPQEVTIHVEVDITGTANWQRYKSFKVSRAKPIRYAFPAAFGAYWVRLVSAEDAVVTGQLEYR
ncbi:MAG: hypothetical protein IH624_01370 [Phycisphaerae bacterium]|nr:hypothetical protein [Phycisphaerae bacterium]